jgi:2'-5' RNA ligase
MRLFAALPVDEPARAELLRVLRALGDTGWPVRWTRDDGLHLTLKFFADVPAERLAQVDAVLRGAAAGTDVLSLQLTELGAFSSRGRPRVLWAGVDGPPALELLQHRIERGAGAIGFPAEARPFRPHVTLGRVREGGRLPRAGFDGLETRLDPVSFTADRLVLYESFLGAGGARHQPRLTLMLGRQWAA